MKLSCIAVDDEPLALEKMETYIAKVDYLDLRGTFDNAFDGRLSEGSDAEAC